MLGKGIGKFWPSSASCRVSFGLRSILPPLESLRFAPHRRSFDASGYLNEHLVPIATFHRLMNRATVELSKVCMYIGDVFFLNTQVSLNTCRAYLPLSSSQATENQADSSWVPVPPISRDIPFLSVVHVYVLTQTSSRACLEYPRFRTPPSYTSSSAVSPTKGVSLPISRGTCVPVTLWNHGRFCCLTRYGVPHQRHPCRIQHPTLVGFPDRDAALSRSRKSRLCSDSCHDKCGYTF